MAETAFDYDRAKTDVRADDAQVRERLAGDTRTPVEMLYFLAGDAESAVRRAVAGNAATPPQADTLLGRDTDYGVRCVLARKLVGEGLATAERRKLWRMGFTILETLACDQVQQVRGILSDMFHQAPDAPHGLVRTLAGDSERAVAEPVLRCSPVLTDDDFVDIIAAPAPDWAQQAIAERESVSPRVTEALGRDGAVMPVAAMIANVGARIEEVTMESIVDRAGQVTDWPAPLVDRPSLSQSLIVRLARVVAAPLLGRLGKRAGLDPGTAAAIDDQVKQRGAGAGRKGGLFRRKARDAETPTQPDSPPDSPPVVNAAEERARALHGDGELTDNAVAMALDDGENEFVIAALAVRAGFSFDRARRIIAAESPRSVTALAWKAGFTMRFAMDLQRYLARIVPTTMLYARDGLDYPMTPAEMTEQLNMFAA